MWNKVWEYLQFLLFGRHCVFCGKALPYDAWYCPDCGRIAEEHWFWNCPLCGESPCVCMPGEYPLDGLIARVDYHHGGKEAVLALKSGTRPSAAKTMAWMMTAWMEEEDWSLLPFDCILPAPSAPSLFQERGEHAVLLAKYLSRQTSIPYRVGYLQKRRFTRRQHTLSSAKQRRENLQKRLILHGPETFEGKTVLLVDDVVTTGSTLTECARLLRKCGAERVYAVAFCRTQRKLNMEKQHSSSE